MEKITYRVLIYIYSLTVQESNRFNSVFDWKMENTEKSPAQNKTVLNYRFS